MWITNWLTNLFEVADRYLIVHRSGLAEAQALALVGQYHSSRIIPLLLMGVSDLLASLVLPHLTHDWELGNRAAVSHRMNLIVKALGLGLASASVGTVLVAPLLFDKIFHGKFAAGKEVLPLVLTYCAWWGLSGLANTYLWCTEKVRVGTISILVGLIATVVLNLILLPMYGLLGAATASLLARLLTLVVMYSFARANGLRWDRGALLATAAPALVLLGPWPSLAGLLTLFALAAFTGTILNTDEKRELAAVWHNNTARLRTLFGTH
jgi:O-antigen/teichoic acid export membrane protein